MKYFHKLLIILLVLISFGCSKDYETEETDTLLNGLVGKFNLDGNGNDETNFQNDGVIVGNVDTIQNRKGREHSAMSFNDFENYIDIGDVTELKLTSEISISVWVNANGNQINWDAIVNKWQDNPGIGNGGLGYYLGLNPNGNVLRWNVTNKILEMTDPFPTNEWVHVAATFNGQILKLYINGILNKQIESQNELADNNVPFRIGQQSELLLFSYGFNGGIDDIYIFNRELTSNEIIELFNK